MIKLIGIIRLLKDIFALNVIRTIFNDDVHGIVSQTGWEILSEYDTET